LGFRVEFACADDRESADQLSLRVTRGGCGDADGEVVYEATLQKGETAPAQAGIGPGHYAFTALALSAGEGLASTCVDLDLPAQEPPLLELRSPNCEATPELDATIIDSDAGIADPTSERDARVEAGEDAEAGDDASDAGDAQPEASQVVDDATAPVDAGGTDADAAPIACATDCKDSFPCTEDRCVNGECVHDPYTGTRECDGIACTQNDKCESGSCKAGTPTNSACQDDGNPCTAETCMVGSGCNRQNSSGNNCNDQISCTGTDKCNNGICRGSDTCTGGAVCSAASGMCLSCTRPQDCDDGEPCTTDTCTTGMCKNTRAVGATCDDGKSCTDNDKCTATSCEGTSSCPSGQSCGGSTCSCNDGSQSLCEDKSVNPSGFVCANLNNNAKFCDSCGRKCADGSSCENRACKPGSNTGNCTAWRDNGHDYLVCSNGKSWTEARDQCRAWGMGLAIIDSAVENTYLTGKSNGTQHWIGANDRGNNGSSGFGSSSTDRERICRKEADEGIWFWASPSANNDHFRALCSFANNTATSCTLTSPSTYQNWPSAQPDNASCSCPSGILGGGCSEGEDCGALLGDGTWNDAVCNNSIGFICESP
jgi:hypothetical protein